MQKWEYCVITGLLVDVPSGFHTHHPKLNYFSSNGRLIEDLGNPGKLQRPKGFEQMDEIEYTASVIARLGNEGWEMVSAVNGGYGTGTLYHCIYFRRPIE